MNYIMLLSCFEVYISRNNGPEDFFCLGFAEYCIQYTFSLIGKIDFSTKCN